MFFIKLKLKVKSVFLHISVIIGKEIIIKKGIFTAEYRLKNRKTSIKIVFCRDGLYLEKAVKKIKRRMKNSKNLNGIVIWKSGELK